MNDTYFKNAYEEAPPGVYDITILASFFDDITILVEKNDDTTILAHKRRYDDIDQKWTIL